MKRIAFLLALVGISFSGCGPETGFIGGEVDPGSVSVQIGSELVTPQYFAFDSKVGSLLDCIVRFRDNRTQQALNDARDCWRDAHAAWEKTEAFLFGPALKAELSKHVDSFPVVVPDIHEKMRVTTPPIVKSKVFYWGGTVKGFHTIEYLLWGEDGNRQLSEFTDTVYDYLHAATSEMWERSEVVRNAWDPSRGDYNKNFVNAGQGTSEFGSSKEVIRAILLGMATVCYDLADRRLGGPLANGPEAQESRFSNNSATDYKNTLVGVANLYYGGAEETGYSIAALINQKDFLLEDRIRAELVAAQKSVDDLGPNFTVTLLNNPNAVRAAQDAVRKLAKSLMEDAMIISQ